MAFDDIPRYAGGLAGGEPDIEHTISLPGDPGDDTAAPGSGHEPPDRLGIHIFLEIVLLLGFAAALFFFYRSENAPLTNGESRDTVIVLVIPLLLAAVAMSLSLRVGAVNLAVGAIGLACGILFADNASAGLVPAMAIALAAAVGFGAVLALAVVVLRTPAWLAGAGVSAVVALWVWRHVDMAGLSIDPISPLPAATAWIWLVSIASLSILGGIVGVMGGWRTRLEACKQAGIGTGRREGATIATIIAALIGSSLLAGLAGIWVVWSATPQAPGLSEGLDPLTLTGFGLGAALLGGTSAYGRRGGVLGTLLAGLVLATLVMMSNVDQWRIHPLWLILAAIGLGAVVTRLVEALGRSDPQWRDDERGTTVDQGRYDATAERYDSAYRVGDIDPYRGVTRQDGYGHH